MADTTFVDGSTVIQASWLNPVNQAVYQGNLTNSTVYTMGSDPNRQLVVAGTPNSLSATRPAIYTKGVTASISLLIGTQGTNGAIIFQNRVEATPITSFQINSNTAAVSDFITVVNNTGTAILDASNSTSSNVNLQFKTKGTGAITFASGSGTQFNVSDTASSVDYFQATGAAAGSSPMLSVVGVDSTIGASYSSKALGVHGFYANSGTDLVARFVPVATPVNRLDMSNAATGQAPTIAFTGSDTNVNGVFTTRGAGSIFFNTMGGGIQLVVASTASAVNSVQLTGAATGNGVTYGVTGSDSNININISPKGTGVLASTGDVTTNTAGKGFRTKEGSNCKQGTAVLVAGSSVVANTSVTANSRIFLTSNIDGGTPGWLRVSTRTAGTSFTITSSSGTDTSTVAYEIFEPG